MLVYVVEAGSQQGFASMMQALQPQRIGTPLHKGTRLLKVTAMTRAFPRHSHTA